jgi:hypothetical protein
LVAGGWWRNFHSNSNLDPNSHAYLAAWSYPNSDFDPNAYFAPRIDTDTYPHSYTDAYS